MLIVFEGIDGSGKNTQVRKLLAFLRQHNVSYRLHKYPTKKAREVFAHLKGEKNVAPERLSDAFADDIMGDQEKISAEIASGAVVVCDRYLHSTLAYQGAGIGYGALRKKLEARGAAAADLLILLDLPAAAGAERKKSQKIPDRHEKDVAFLERVRKNYLKMAADGFLAYKCAKINAGMGKAEIFSQIITRVEPLIIRKLEKN